MSIIFTDPKQALAAGYAVGMWRIERDDIIWRLPGDQESGVTFKGVATERTVPHASCGWFFTAKPDDVKAHKVEGYA